jgi:hypothetical protein
MTPAERSCIVGRTPVVFICAESEDRAVSFRLLYEGELLSSQAGDKTAILKNKHGIRKQLHKQLKELWKNEDMLRTVASVPVGFFAGTLTPEEAAANHPGLASIAANFARGNYQFVPLVMSRFHLVCSLDILFLRRESPGAIVQGGDIDNRINTLFDGLQLPKSLEQITEQPTEDERPFYCLLEDDRLITEVKVTTDRLLRPVAESGQHKINEVVLVISVTLNQTSRFW